MFTQDSFVPGTHLVARRFGYQHHGIYVGNGAIVHYTGFKRGLHTGPIEETTTDVFANGQRVWVCHDRAPAFDPLAIIARARSRIGERRYRLLSNNCRHFCEWCLYGEVRRNDLLGWIASELSASRVK